jgi:hypothetical protein
MSTVQPSGAYPTTHIVGLLALFFLTNQAASFNLMGDTRYNIRMTRSNVKSPKFLSEKLSTFEGKRISATKAN